MAAVELEWHPVGGADPAIHGWYSNVITKDGVFARLVADADLPSVLVLELDDDSGQPIKLLGSFTHAVLAVDALGLVPS